MESRWDPSKTVGECCVERTDTCLARLDVIRDDGLVIDYHNNGVDSHMLMRCLPGALFFDKSSCS